MTIGCCAGYLLNLLSLLALTILRETNSSIIAAVLYVLIVPPLAFLSWHWSLYKAVKYGSHLWYGLSCLALLIQLIDAGLVGVGLAQGATGLLVFLRAFASVHVVAAVLAGLSMAGMGVLVLLGGAYLMPRVLANWGRRGEDRLGGALAEAATLAKDNPAVQRAAINNLTLG